jgi:hypothetical protein
VTMAIAGAPPNPSLYAERGTFMAILNTTGQGLDGKSYGDFCWIRGVTGLWRHVQRSTNGAMH